MMHDANGVPLFLGAIFSDVVFPCSCQKTSQKEPGSSNFSKWSSISNVPQGQGGIDASSCDFSTETLI